MAYFKDLPRRTTSDKVKRDKAFNIAKNSKFGGYQNCVASMVYKCATTHTGIGIKSENQKLAE